MYYFAYMLKTRVHFFMIDKLGQTYIKARKCVLGLINTLLGLRS